MKRFVKPQNFMWVALILSGALLQGCLAEPQPPKLKPAASVEGNIYPVVIGNENLMGYVNDARQIVIEAQFESAREFNEGLAAVHKDEKWGYIDRSGQWAINPRYDYANDFEDGLAVTMKRKDPGVMDGIEYCSVIDTSGKTKVKTDYFRVFAFLEGLAPVWFSYIEDQGFMDQTGAAVIEGYDQVHIFSEGLAAVSQQDKWGYIDRTGKVIVPLIYDEVFAFNEKSAAVKTGNKWGYIDAQGKEIVAPLYDSASLFSEGLAVVEYKGNFGFINSSGEWVIPPKFDDAQDFSEGLAAVFVDDIKKWGYIDKKGEIVIEPEYLEAFPTEHGLMKVSREQIGEYSYIDRQGNHVEFKPLSEQRSKVRQG
ncbi:WG repeat-containing protein [Saccharibacillus sacchari]|uniref:WG repeat-containing protein n=1 Tax=Saccharibacillus sacchari TaxID=456493 RepID=UPI0004BA3A77|nr:WG repeat-containing protein [Saccharibacillus sacchari]